MFCKNCGKEIAENAVACVHCGCAPKVGSKFCGFCGAEITNGQVVCTKCGHAIDVGSVSGGVSQGSKSRVVAALLAIFLGEFGAHQFYLGNMVSAIIRLGVSLVAFVCGGMVVMSLIGIVEGIIYFAKSDEQFYSTYVLGKKAWF